VALTCLQDDTAAEEAAKKMITEARRAKAQSTKEGLAILEAECVEAAAKSVAVWWRRRESKSLAVAAATAPDDASRSLKLKRKRTEGAACGSSPRHSRRQTDFAVASHKALRLPWF
jgi:hypothetical protein